MNPLLIIVCADVGVVVLFILYRLLELRKLLNPNLIKAYIRMPNRKWAIHFVPKTPTKTGWQIRLKGHKTAYNIDPDCIDYMGMLRMPTGHWNYNKADMINFGTLEASSSVASNDYFEQTEHHVLQELLYTLKKEFFTPAMTIIIMLVVMGVGFFFIYTEIGGVKKSVGEIRGAIIAVPEETETP